MSKPLALDETFAALRGLLAAPVYMKPELLESVPPSLKKRMQGKACFNFTTVDRDQLKELAAVTKTGIAAFRDVKLPWNKE